VWRARVWASMVSAPGFQQAACVMRRL